MDRRARFLGPDLYRDHLSPIGQCVRYPIEWHTVTTDDHTNNFNAMSTANIDPVLLEHAIVLNTIDIADPSATVRYDMMSDALIWSDETAPDMPIELIWSLRIVFNYRTHLIRGTKIDDTSVWDYYNLVFPRWIGFAPNRRTATKELLDLYRRGDVSTRWCLRRLERESEAYGG